MKLFDWFKNLWNDDVEYFCPKCGSSNIGYFSVTSNFSQLVNGKDPEYENGYRCLDCGYKVYNLKDLTRRKRQAHKV